MYTFFMLLYYTNTPKQDHFNFQLLGGGVSKIKNPVITYGVVNVYMGLYFFNEIKDLYVENRS